MYRSSTTDRKNAVEAELNEYLVQFAARKDEMGHKQVVPNGFLPVREMPIGISPVAIKIPNIGDNRRQGGNVNSTLLPPSVRKTKSIEEVLSWQYF